MTKKITFEITKDTKTEWITSAKGKLIKISAQFSNGEVRKLHFPLDASKKTILTKLEQIANSMDEDSVLAEQMAERVALEKKAAETVSNLTK